MSKVSPVCSSLLRSFTFIKALLTFARDLHTHPRPQDSPIAITKLLPAMPALRSDPPPVGRSCARELRGRLHSSSFLVLVLATILLLVIDVTATPRPAITLAFWSSVQHGARGGFIARGYPVHFALKLAAGLAPPSLYRVDFGDGSATVTASANATISHTFLRAGRFTVRFHAYTTNVAQTIGPDVNVTDASSGYVFPAGGGSPFVGGLCILALRVLSGTQKHSRS